MQIQVNSLFNQSLRGVFNDSVIQVEQSQPAVYIFTTVSVSGSIFPPIAESKTPQ